MEGKTVYLKFFSPIDNDSITRLLGTVEIKLRDGYSRIVLLLSSPGGSVFHGMSAYNSLKGIPAQVWTHNFGSVDSIGVVLYCAGIKRMCVPHARFLIHGVSAQFGERTALEEPQLEERLKGLRIDVENIAGIVAANTGRSEKQVRQDMLKRATLNPEQAVEYGLVHEVVEKLLPAGAELITV